MKFSVPYPPAPHPVDRVRVRDANGEAAPTSSSPRSVTPARSPTPIFGGSSSPPIRPRHRVTTTFSLNNLDAADFDRDGDIGLVTAEHKGAGLRVLLFENDGRGRFTERVLDRGKESHLGTRAADLDGDGDRDLVSIGWNRHRFLRLWRNDTIPPPSRAADVPP